jgi:hypothetical protein
MAYASLAELRAYSGISPGDTADDATLQIALDAAQEQIDSWTGNTFEADASPTTRTYVADSSGYVSVAPISTTTGLVVKTDDNGDGTFETTWTLGTHYRLEPINAAAEGKAWTRIVGLGTRYFPRHAYYPGVEVTARFGWVGAVPAAIKQATLLQASRLHERRGAPFGVAGSPELGSEVRLLARLDPDVEALVRPYRRQWWVVI